MFKRTYHTIAAGAATLLLCFSAVTAMAQEGQSEDPIRIGFSMSLSGALAGLGKTTLIAMEIWKEDINAQGGLLGRPVELVYYDDQSTGSNVPSIYAKLLHVDNVDLVIGPFATNMTAPAMPVIMQNEKTFISLWCGDCNAEYGYDRYFSMAATGADPKTAFTEGFFDVAMKQEPKPQTIAIVSADGEASHLLAEGGRIHAERNDLEIVYDRSYPLGVVDLTPVVRAIEAADPDILLICSYPLDSVAMVRAINEISFQAKIMGGAMNGIPSPALKAQLGSLLNGFVNYEFWVPVGGLDSQEAQNFITTYRERAEGEGVDPIGLYVPPWAYSYIQVLGQAVEGAQSLNDAEIAEYLRNNTFDTLVGEVTFGEKGEWAESRMFTTQYRGIEGNGMEQFNDLDDTQVILWPPDYTTGELIYPYSEAVDD